MYTKEFFLVEQILRKKSVKMGMKKIKIRISLAVKKRGKFSPLARIESGSEKKDINFLFKLILKQFLCI